MNLASLSRRRFLTGTSLAALGALTACNASSSTAPTPTPSAASGFPATVTHKFGTTEIPTAPQRIVSVGLTEQDALLALGQRPVAVTEWYGKQPYAIWPWAKAALGDLKPEVLMAPDGFPFENISALQPDLIIGTNSGMNKSDFDKMAKLAPTIPGSGKYKSDWFEPWPVQTQQIGIAVGKQDEAKALIDTVKQKFTDAQAAHPEFVGKKAIFLQAPYYEGNAIAYQNGLSTDFLTDLGFTIPKEIDAYASQDAQAYIPVEKLDVLDAADVLIWATEDDKAKAELEKNKLFGQLRAVREGRSLYTGGELAGAIYFSTVLSLPYVVDQLVPQLAEALAA